MIWLCSEFCCICVMFWLLIVMWLFDMLYRCWISLMNVVLFDFEWLMRFMCLLGVICIEKLLYSGIGWLL